MDGGSEEKNSNNDVIVHDPAVEEDPHALDVNVFAEVDRAFRPDTDVLPGEDDDVVYSGGSYNDSHGDDLLAEEHLKTLHLLSSGPSTGFTRCRFQQSGTQK